MDRIPTDQGLVLRISGRITRDELDLLHTAIQDGPVVAIELSELELVDRDAVKFLATCETDGIELRYCPAYIREWIAREQ